MKQNIKIQSTFSSVNVTAWSQTNTENISWSDMFPVHKRSHNGRFCEELSIVRYFFFAVERLKNAITQIKPKRHVHQKGVNPFDPQRLSLKAYLVSMQR